MPRNFSPRRGLFLGTNVCDGASLYLRSGWLTTGVHILGRTGSGKTRTLLAFIEQLIGYLDATIIVINPKGDLGRMVRDATIAAGQARRLVVFDPADTAPVCGYNPLRPNALDPHTQAKAARDAILAGVGQVGLERTPQLARFLHLVLASARLCELTLVEALELLLPESPIRPQVLRELSDPYLARALAYFDTLRASRQDELAASTIARLDSFVSDPTIRRIVMQQTHALDVGAVIRERRILLANLELYRPLRPNEAKLLGRMLINDVIAHVFGRIERSPVFLFVDEVELFATPDLCTVTNLGREMGLCLFAAHQNLEQLTLEAGDKTLREAMLNNAVTKIVCGSPTYKDLMEIGPELFVDEFDPRRAKHDHIELDPIEERRQSVTASVSRGRSWSETTGKSRSIGYGETVGENQSVGSTDSRGAAVALSDSETDVVTLAKSTATVESHGTSAADSLALRIDPATGEASEITAHSTGHFAATSVAHGTASARTRARTTGRSDTWSETHGESEESGFSSSSTTTRTTGRSKSEQHGTQESEALAVQDSPWHSYRKRRVPTAFWSFDESLLAFIQKIRRQGTGSFVVKVPTAPAAFVRAPYVKVPWVSSASRTRALEQMRALPFYAQPDQIAAEEAARRTKLLEPPKPQSKKLPRTGEKWDFSLPKPTDKPKR